MAVKLLQVLLLGVIAAAADDDVPIKWVPSPRAVLQCQIPDGERIPARRPPPPLEGDGKTRPKPYIWRRGNDELKRRSQNGSLEVSRKKDPEGVYQCAVKYQSGYVLGYPFHLKYAYIDKQFTEHPSNATAWRGQPFVLRCNISSGPAAHITWVKDGEALPESDRYYILNNQLLITEVTDDDAGFYKCRATNPVLNKVRNSHGGRLEVDYSPYDIPPSFVPMYHEEDIVVPVGSKVVLPCPMYGRPRPKLRWEFTRRESNTVYDVPADQVLVLPAVRLNDEGVYLCRDDTSDLFYKRFNITVTEPVNITHAPEFKQSMRASTVRFNCTATGKPTPKVTWYKDGKELKYAGRIDHVPSYEDKSLLQLLIRGVTSEDAGVYQCMAAGAGGAASRWAALEVRGAEAAAPRAVRCAPEAADALRVSWSPAPPDVQVVAYTVITTSPDGNSLPDSPVTSTETLVNVKLPLTTYGFQVRAYIGSSSATSSTNTGNNNNKLKADIVSQISETVYCQGQGVPIKLMKNPDGSLLVSWWDFYKENRGVVEWIVQYRAENSTLEHNVTLEGKVYNYTLKTSEQVQVRVLGSRAARWAPADLARVPWASAAATTGPGVVRLIPEDVEVTEVNARNVTVRWRCEHAAPPHYTYFVCVRRVNGNQDCTESSVKWAVITHLSPDTHYEVRVQARLAGGAQGGDFSAPIDITTKPDGQGSLRDITYTHVNLSVARVSWSSAPREYTVRYSAEGNLPRAHWNKLQVVGNTVLLNDLDPTKELFVIVEGDEPVGHSPMLIIPAQIPEATNLKYSYSRAGVVVTWKGEGPRVVKYSQNLTQFIEKWSIVNINDTNVEITGLDPSQPTFVMVAAPGSSQHSTVLTVPPRPVETTAAPRPLDNTVRDSGTNDEFYYYLYIALGCGLVSLLILAAGFAYCIWQKRKQSRMNIRSRRRHSSHTDGTEEEAAEMKIQNVGGRLANGGGSKDAGEPLLNGHVHITENPSTKTSNGKIWKGRYDAAFDVTRYDALDTTAETALDVSGLSGVSGAAGVLGPTPDGNMNTRRPHVKPNG